MTRKQNLQAMMALNVARCVETSPDAQLKIHKAFYTHQIIEAILSGNIESLKTAA